MVEESFGLAVRRLNPNTTPLPRLGRSWFRFVGSAFSAGLLGYITGASHFQFVCGLRAVVRRSFVRVFRGGIRSFRVGSFSPVGSVSRVSVPHGRVSSRFSPALHQRATTNLCSLRSTTISTTPLMPTQAPIPTVRIGSSPSPPLQEPVRTSTHLFTFVVPPSLIR